MTNWDDLKIFLAVARGGSLSAAARALKVTQPTVGRRLKALEAAMGTRLFDRLPDGFVPTAAGDELRPLAEAMESSALAVDRRQASLRDGLRGTVRVSLWESFAPFLTDYLGELNRQLPEIEIEIGVSHNDANLGRREADLLIRECLPENPDLIARKIGSYAYAVYGARDYVAAHPEAHGEGRYRDCQWVGYDEAHAYFQNQKWLLARLEGRLPHVRIDDGLVLHQAVTKGNGLGVLPCFAGDADERLIRLTPPLAEVTRDLHMVVHRDLRRSPAVRAVMDALIAIYRREAPRLLGQIEKAA